MKRRLLLVAAAASALLLVLALGIVSLESGQPDLPPPPQQYNVLWITAESMKPEHLGAYGYARPTSPNIDEFAAAGTLFRWCFNPSAWTSENMVSNLTGVPSPLHGVNSRGHQVPAEWYLPLEQLRDRGYRVPRMEAFQQDPNYRDLGFEDGVENVAASEWLEAHHDGPFFMWFHLLQTHLPYDAPEPHRGLFWRDDLIPDPASRARVETTRANLIIPRGSVAFDKDKDLAGIRALYDADVHYMDETFGEIIATVDRLGLRDKTIIVFSADHGEEQLEHGFVGHASTAKGGTLHDEILHVPLIVSLPGVVPAGLKVTTQVRGIDVMPTLFDLLGLAPEPYFLGTSLLPVLQDPAKAEDRVAFSASSYAGYQEADPNHIEHLMYSVRTPKWKFLADVDGKGVVATRLFDLAEDPGEQHDVAATVPQVSDAMNAQLEAWLHEVRATKVTTERGNLFRSGLARLKRLVRGARQGARVAPIIEYPAEGAVVSFESTGGKVALSWSGSPDVNYLVAVEAGTGDQRLETTLDVDGPAVTREFSQSYWNDYVRRYATVRFRVRANVDGSQWSSWRSVVIR